MKYIEELKVIAHKPYSLQKEHQSLSVVLTHDSENWLHPYTCWVHDSSGDHPILFSAVRSKKLEKAIQAFNEKGIASNLNIETIKNH